MESLERDLNEETGWKLVHGDVFRPPAHRMLLAAAVGTGIQLVMLGLFVILLTIMGTFYEVRDGSHGAIWTLCRLWCCPGWLATRGAMVAVSCSVRPDCEQSKAHCASQLCLLPPVQVVNSPGSVQSPTTLSLLLA